MLSATNHDVVSRGQRAADAGEASSSRRMSVADAAALLAERDAWYGLPTLAQLALYRREDGAYFCAVEDCEIVGPPKRDSDRMVTIGALVFCHEHGKAVHRELCVQYNANSRCQWHYLSKTVHFAEQANERATLKPERNNQLPARFVSVDEVAEAILGGQLVERAGKRPRSDGYGQETQCVVAANAPHLCNRWGDWGKMRTASAPSTDGSPPRAHYGFCPECAAVCAAAELTLGPSLRDMIVGKQAEKPRAVRPPQEVLRNTGAVEEQLRRVELASIFRRASCNMAPEVTGDPSEGLDTIPVFRSADFPDHYAGDRALDETNDPWWLRIRNHAATEMTDAAFRRDRSAMKEATSMALQCFLHGPFVGMLAEFRSAVKEYYKEQWPTEWAERVARAKSYGTGNTDHGNGSGSICMYCRERPGSQLYGNTPACTRCKNRLTRPKREAKAAARSAADRAAATGGNGGGKKTGGGKK